MTTQSITSRQKKQLEKIVTSTLEDAVRDALALASLGEDGIGNVVERKSELTSAVATATFNILKKLSSRYPVLVETSLLKPVVMTIVPARTKPFNATEFFQTGPGLYVWETFSDRLDLKVRQIVNSAPERPYVASLLKENAYDRDIRKELPDTHLSTLEDIAGLIEAQSGGKPGFLQNNGYANIFYVNGKNSEVFAVTVRWHSGDREWNVRGWELDGDGDWGAGRRVLCPGNAALAL